MRPDILTFRGHYFDFERPEASPIAIDDVAHGLAMTCRYHGQCRRFYSVAQHSVLVSRIVPPEDAFAGLMHDAAEAYIGDIASPLKRMLPDYRAVEARVEAAIATRFLLTLPWPASVKRADLVMLATEQRDLMAGHDDQWAMLEGVEPLEQRVCPVDHDTAKRMFLARFATLFDEHCMKVGATSRVFG